MKPILILQHLSADGPGYFGHWLREQAVPFEVCNTQAGPDFPPALDTFSALAVLGGEMSANDPLPSLRQAEALILQAVNADKPVIGHCLGGQLMARALGGRVMDSPAPEIGWQRIDLLPGAQPQSWFGQRTQATVFQWHFEAFELPPGATALARSPVCTNQAFALGPHLGMQFHVEVDVDKVTRWSHDKGERWRAAQQQYPATVQGPEALRAGLQSHLPAQQGLARQLYVRWLQAVSRR